LTLKTSGKELEQLIEMYKADFITVYIEEYKAIHNGLIPDEMEIPTLTIKSIREEGICKNENDIIDYALDRVDPNFGMSSDILRYRILFKYGGGYVDVTDVTPAMPIDQSIFRTGDILPPCHAVFLDHLSQKLNPKQIELQSFELTQLDSKKLTSQELEFQLATRAIGNDTFFCTQGNPLMQHLAECAQNNFLFVLKKDSVGALMMAYTGYNVKDLTIEKTGPTLVTRELLDLTSGKLGKHPTLPFTCIKLLKDKSILIKPVRCSQYLVTQPTKNTRMWNNVEFDNTAFPNIDIACQKMINIIRFEAIEMKILRLDDHLRILGKIAKLLGQNPQEAQAMLLKAIEVAQPPIPFEGILYPQSVSCNPFTDEFYISHNLFDKIYLLKVPLEEQERLQGQVNRFINIFESVTSFQYFSTKMFEDNMLAQTTTNIIEQYHKPLEIAGMFDMIDRGSEFILKIFAQKGKYPMYDFLTENISEFNSAKTDLINKYAKILGVYQEAFLKSGVSKQEILEINRRIFQLCGESALLKKLNSISATYNCGSDYEKALRNAVVNNKIDDVKFLVEWVNVNAIGPSTGQSALHIAASKGNPEIILLLLTKGADPTLKDFSNKTPSELAPQELKNLFPSSTETNTL
jgi:hypothetical protein